jgi:hypothetical protein
MSLVRFGVSIVAAAAGLLAVFAGATVWLLVTDPVTLADAVSEGEVTPLVRELAAVLYGALLGLLRFL